jgi:hypothetical protein
MESAKTSGLGETSIAEIKQLYASFGDEAIPHCFTKKDENPEIESSLSSKKDPI